MSNDVFAASTSVETVCNDDAQVESNSSVEVTMIEDSTPADSVRVPVEVVIHDASDSDDDLPGETNVASVDSDDVCAGSVDVESPNNDFSAVVVETQEPVESLEAAEAANDETVAPEVEVAEVEAEADEKVRAEEKVEVEVEQDDDDAEELSVFEDMGLSPEVMQAIQTTGYQTPSPIQLETVPYILAGRDLMGQAETGSGKTAAFAWPILSKIDTKLAKPQVLVLAPTRELAIQVTAAFEKYAAGMKGFRAVTIYGGQSYETQLRALSRGVHVVVGTPGRVMDHLRRETLDLKSLKTLVLDEADEMLRMGFIDDVEWILEQIPAQRQILSFSATLPEPIREDRQKVPQQSGSRFDQEQYGYGRLHRANLFVRSSTRKIGHADSPVGNRRNRRRAGVCQNAEFHDVGCRKPDSKRNHRVPTERRYSPKSA